MRGCSVEGCLRPHKAKGWCNMHYERSRNGLPVEADPGEDILDRLARAKVPKRAVAATLANEIPEQVDAALVQLASYALRWTRSSPLNRSGGRWG